MSEHRIQKAYFQWLRYKLPRVEPLAFSVPNGGYRFIATAARLKAEGVKAGVPDIFIAYPQKSFHGLFMELKTERGRPTKQQLQWLERLGSKGYMAMLCKGLDALIETTEGYFSDIDQITSEEKEIAMKLALTDAEFKARYPEEK